MSKICKKKYFLKKYCQNKSTVWNFFHKFWGGSSWNCSTACIMNFIVIQIKGECQFNYLEHAILMLKQVEDQERRKLIYLWWGGKYQYCYTNSNFSEISTVQSSPTVGSCTYNYRIGVDFPTTFQKRTKIIWLSRQLYKPWMIIFQRKINQKNLVCNISRQYLI